MSHSHFPYHPHHRSSEVFSEGFSTTTTAATSVKSTKANDDSTSDYLEISMVRPITIEDAIHRMQKVPSVEFACRFMKKHSIASSDICISASTATDHRNNNQFSAHSAALNKAFLNNKDISNEKSDKFCLETLPTQVLVHKPALYRNSTAHICNNNSRYGGSKQSNFEDNCNSITYQCADLITPKTCSNQICFNAPLTNIKSPSSTFGTVTTLTSATTPVLRCSSFSYRSNKNVIGNSGSNNNNNNISSNLAEFDHATRGSFSLRRATIARLGSDAADSEYYFVPKQSWLTSVYVKLPQSKSLRRIQLKLLNLPFFASVGRFLEETCTTTRSDQKAFLEDNSFLFAMFNQFVPHNRIPLNTLSQYVRRLQKYEILAIIEFNVSNR